MDENDFKKASHTLVVSDIHLSETEKFDPARPLWKRYKLPEHLIDSVFREFLDGMSAKIVDTIELILNGDIFDFDSVMRIPERAPFHVSWLERLRGLASEEQKSRFKVRVILETHPVWIDSLRRFLLAGNRVVFIIGNHDLELHWGSVRQDIVDSLDLPAKVRDQIRFCDWFYISNQDTLIEHGNQYDSYCLCANPIFPLIKKGSRKIIRIPFGNLAGKYMTNGMGLMNPHATTSFIKSSAWEYFIFYYKYMIRIQPFLLWTWLWSAMVTLFESVTEGLLPSVRDPLTVDARMADIAKRSNAPLSVVLALKEVHVHPAIFNPIKILRELWLDRAILLVFIFTGSFQFFSVLKVFVNVSLAWFLFPLLLLFPLFFFYARSVHSEVDSAQRAAFQMAPLVGKIAHVKRIVQGHTHIEAHASVGELEVLNTGTWSPAYRDVECQQPFGRKCFAWIQPAGQPGSVGLRVAELYEWQASAGIKLIQRT